MKKQDGGGFEERLLAKLRAVVAERGKGDDAAPAAVERPPARRRRAPRLALGGAAALAAAVLVVLLVGGGGDNPPKAFAVEPLDGGGVKIRVHSLEDAAGLEAALAKAGIPSQVDWLPAGMTCREPRFTPSKVRTALGGKVGGVNGAGPREHPLTIGVMSTEQYREQRRMRARGEISSEELVGSTGNFSLDPAEFQPGQSVVLSGSPGPYKGDPEGGYEFRFAIAVGPVEPCEAVEVPVEESMLHETEEVFREEREEREERERREERAGAEGGVG